MSDKVAAIIDDNGRLQGHFIGDTAKQDAQNIVKDCHGKVRHLHGATVVTGEKALKAIREGRL